MSLKGIDTSSYQGLVDWNKVKESNIDFAILKIIKKDLQPDKQFENSWANCEKANMPIQGVYNYSYATTVEKAVGDARRVVEVLDGRKTFVWLDVEDKCQQNIGQRLIDIINEYQKVIQNAGLGFGVYTGLSFYNSYILPFASQINCPFWIARYPLSRKMQISENPSNIKKPSISHQMYGWQYTSSLVVPGIDGNVDANILYIDLNKNSEDKHDSTPSASAPNPTKSNESWKGDIRYYLDNSNVKSWQKAMNIGFDTTDSNKLSEDAKFGAKSQAFAKEHLLWKGQKHNCITAIRWLRKTLRDKFGFSKLSYDEGWTDYLTKCVITFQKNRGLKPDGVVGLITTYYLLK